MDGVSPKKRLNDLLVEQGLVSAAQLRECLELQRQSRKNLLAILIEKGYVAEEEMVVVLSDQLGLAHIRISNYHISEEVLAEVPATLARQYGMLPVMLTDNVLTLAMSNPLNQMALDDLRLLTSHDLELVIAMPSELNDAIEKYYTPQEAPPPPPKKTHPETSGPPRETVVIAPDTPVEVMAQRLIGSALEEEATELYLEPLKDRLRIRFRVEGELGERPAPPKDRLPELIQWLKNQSGAAADSAGRVFHGHFISRAQERKTLCIVSVLPSRYGETVSLRLCVRGERPQDLEALEFEPATLAAISGALTGPAGMLLLAGPRGSGRSTTLYSCLDRAATAPRRAVALEDTPICLMEEVLQIPAGAQAALSYPQAIRHILRQQVDVLLIGELVDPETAAMAAQAALNGTLVLATLGAHDAAGAFPALAALGISPDLAAATVRLTVAQRLLRRICPECIKTIAPSQNQLDDLQYRPFDNIPQTQFSHGRGCNACRNTGYRGRVACAEALRNSPEIQYLLAEGAPAGRLKRKALDEGMISMRQEALAKAARGLSTLEEVAARTIADHTEDRVT